MFVRIQNAQAYGLVNSRDFVSALCKIICILPTNYFNYVEAVVWSKRSATPLWISSFRGLGITPPKNPIGFGIRIWSALHQNPSTRTPKSESDGGWGRLIRPTPPVGGSKGGRSSPLTKKWCSSMLHSPNYRLLKICNGIFFLIVDKIATSAWTTGKKNRFFRLFLKKGRSF
jgi:hypothetical protein